MPDLLLHSVVRDRQLEQARAELEERLRSGEVPAAEKVLAAHPELAADPDCALQVIYDELVLREQLGEEPAYAEYYARFPQWRDELRKSFDLHDTLVRKAAKTPAPGSFDPTGAAARTPHEPQYELLGEIGRGGMGVVYKARQPGLNRIVALKMILAGEYAGAEERSRFRTEAEASARLQHPHIVQVYEVGEQDSRPFLALEYVDGGSLAERLAGTPLPAREAGALLETLARAVHYAHEHRVLHRDLKPANVLLTADGAPKIADFGLAKQLPGAAAESTVGNPTQSGAILGTPSYMAPEQAAGQLKAVGPATDVYALGALLYECLTGRPPFKGATPLETLMQVKEQEPVPPRRLSPQVPRDLETICLKCLQKEPPKRYASALDLADDLKRHLAGETIRARPAGTVERLWRWCRRRPAVASLLAMLTLVVFGGLLVVTGLWLHAEQQRERAVTNLAEANDNFDLARQAVNELYVKATEDPALQEDGLQPVRRQLLEPALKYYQTFLEKRRHDPRIRSELAAIHYRVARIHELFGNKRDALAADQEAARYWEELVQSDSGNTNFRAGLARTYLQMGMLQSALGQIEPARQAFQRGMAMQRALVESYPRNLLYLDILAGAYTNLGNLHLITGAPRAALESHQQALTLREQLVARAPGDAEQVLHLIAVHRSIGNVYATLDNPETALRHYTQARARAQNVLLEPALQVSAGAALASSPRMGFLLAGGTLHAAKVPNRIHRSTRTAFHRDLAITCTNLGEQQRLLRRYAEALEALQGAHFLLVRLIEANPAVSRYQDVVALVYLSMGRIHADRRETAAALPFLQQALAVWKKLVEIEPEDIDWRGKLAFAYYALGELHFKNQDPATALQDLEQARLLHERLVRDHPDHPDYQHYLALVCSVTGQAQVALHDKAAAESSYRHAERLLNILAGKYPAIARYRKQQAITCNRLGGLHHETGNYKAALQLCEQAIRIQSQLVQDQPGNFAEQFALARNYCNLGLIHTTTKDLVAAQSAYHQALPILRELILAGPDNLDWKQQLGSTCHHLGKLQHQAGKPAGALPSFEEACRHYEALVQARPNDPRSRTTAASNYGHMAQSLEALKRHDQARDAYRQAVEQARVAVENARQDPFSRQALGYHYQQLARFERVQQRPAEAAAASVERGKLYPNDPQRLYAVADELARCVALVGTGKTALTKEEQAERQKYADLTMAALRQAVAARFEDVQRLKNDQVFTPLRQRDDFRKLVADLEEKKGRSPPVKPEEKTP